MSRPLAIPTQRRPAAVVPRRGGHDFVSASVPNAPVIGSLPTNKMELDNVPALDLPPSSPQAFSLVSGCCTAGRTWRNAAACCAHGAGSAAPLQRLGARSFTFQLRVVRVYPPPPPLPSQAIANSLPAPSRMVGVSSAPAVSFLDQARASR
jgi:hypothetical protein